MVEREALIAEAKRLRVEEGWSCQRIADRLGVSRTTVREWLSGVPVPDWTRRPNAKDELREQAIALRLQGWSVNDIAVELGVARSTTWLWVRHLPLDPDSERAVRKRAHGRMMADARWREHRVDRDAHRAAIVLAGSDEVGSLSERELLLLGAAIYWCEGSKEKAWRPQARITFSNSDPGLIRLFLRFLAAVGVTETAVRFRLHIHESTDVSAAERWWMEQLAVPAERFQRATLKRHLPKTNRRNIGADYHGCLSVTVSQGRQLYWRIEGIMSGIVATATGATVADAAG